MLASKAILDFSWMSLLIIKLWKGICMTWFISVVKFKHVHTYLYFLLASQDGREYEDRIYWWSIMILMLCISTRISWYKNRFTEFYIMKLKVKITLLYVYLKWYALDYMQCTIGYIFKPVFHYLLLFLN